MIGRTLSHYRITAPLGEGGMGVVYRAQDLHLARDVALKVLTEGSLVDEAARLRFRREALALSRVNHPHIAAVYDFDTQDAIDFLVMELVEGEPLSARIERGPLPEAEVRELGAQIADALEAAHEQDIIHRDLKPGNVMLTARGQVKVLDFGLARLRHAGDGVDLSQSLTATDVTIGTVPYMAPEQLLGHKVDARADLYALGVVLYEMATGRSPYRETIRTALIYEIIHQPVPPPRRVAPSLTQGLESVILNCLGKDPDARYASARAVAEDLRSSAPVRRHERQGRRGLMLLGAALAAVAAVLFLLDVGGLRRGFQRGGQIHSLAVLPLENLSNDPEQEYFADGMTEELINRLARIGALRVTSRSSVMAFKGVHKTAPEIARRLHVDAIVEGTVRRASDRVRIAVQLVQAGTDKNLWGSSYERDIGDVFALQSDVAQAIVGEIRIAVTPDERSRLASSQRVDPAAHEEYLRGRFYWGQFTKDGFLKSIGHFQKAVEIDPSFALAHIGIADAYAGMSTTFMAPDSAIPMAQAATARAFQLDPNLPEAYTSRGYTRAFYDWRWSEAERDFKRAIELNPGSAWTHAAYGYLLSVNGRFEEAIAEFARAHEIDPLSPFINSMRLWPLYEGRRYDQAIALAQQIIEEDSTAWNAHQILIQSYLEKRDYDGAAAASRVWSRAMPVGAFEGRLVQMHAQQGKVELALRELEKATGEPHSAYEIGLIYGALGKKDEAFAWLERDMKARLETVIWLKVDPKADPLRPDPRFGALLKRLGLGP